LAHFSTLTASLGKYFRRYTTPVDTIFSSSQNQTFPAMSHSLTSIELTRPIGITRPESVAYPSSNQSEQLFGGRRSSILSTRPAIIRRLTAENNSETDVSKGQTVVVISSVTVITGISSLLAGLVTVGLPTIAKELDIPSGLVLW
jgi:hypothetical protein